LKGHDHPTVSHKARQMLLTSGGLENMETTLREPKSSLNFRQMDALREPLLRQPVCVETWAKLTIF
jgi:hypothetical protein